MSASTPSSPDVAYRLFLELEGSATGPLAGVELLPARLMAALSAILPVDGAGLSVLSGIRVPLGASNEYATAAERLQSTLGDGPCLTAYAQSEALLAHEERLQECWPVFYDELVEHTPFRTVASIPMFTGMGRFGAIDLYWNTPSVPDENTSMEAAATLAPVIASLLTTSSPQTNERLGVSTQAWIEAPPVRARMQVWQAIGMLNARKLNSANALSVLRAAAYSRDLTIDELSEQLIARQISAQQIMD